jgi:hypothetical protein
MLSSGVPNIYYPTPPPLLTGASNSDPALNPPASSLCANSTPICVLTAQYDNARTDANAKENVFTNANVSSTVRLGSFLVDTSGLPSATPPFTQNPTYAQPLYVPGLSIGGGTHNVVFIVTLNGEVYAYDADNISTPTKYWYRDETNVTGMKGLKHNCDGTSGPGSSVPKNGSGSKQVGYLDFAGVISTPVIDAAPVSPNPLALYVVNLCQDAVTSNQHWYVDALNLTTGATLTSPPLEITYNAMDVSNNPYGPQQPFFADSQLQRPGLLLTYSTTTNQRSVNRGIRNFSPRGDHAVPRVAVRLRRAKPLQRGQSGVCEALHHAMFLQRDRRHAHLLLES